MALRRKHKLGASKRSEIGIPRWLLLSLDTGFDEQWDMGGLVREEDLI
jgi:hypothetical protein